MFLKSEISNPPSVLAENINERIFIFSHFEFVLNVSVVAIQKGSHNLAQHILYEISLILGRVLRQWILQGK
jgi:hypothetical protein